MAFSRRRSEVSEQQADELAEIADDLAENEPDSKFAATVAQQSLDAAEARLRVEESVANRRRVGRALWRQGSLALQGNQRARKFVPAARRCWLVSRQAIELTESQDPQRDLMIGELMQRAAAFICPVLSGAGYPDEATAMVQECEALVKSSPGPRARQGWARINLSVSTALAEMFVKVRMDGQWSDGHTQQVRSVQIVAQSTVDQLREYRDDGPLEVSELAKALWTISRLMFACGEIAAADRTLREAISLFASVADRGPNYRTWLRAVEADRNALTEQITGPREGTRPLDPPSPRPTSPTDQQADELADQADALAESDPDSELAATVAQQSLDAAEARLRAEETVASRRRVGRALWRQGMIVVQGDQPASRFVAPARRCWLISRQAVELTEPQDPLRDLVIGELLQRAATFVCPVLSEAGHPDEAYEVMEFCEAVHQSSSGPRSHQGWARMNLTMVTGLADQFVQARTNGRWSNAEAQQAQGVRAVAESVVDQLRPHRDDGPLEVSELAKALWTLSRLMFVSDDIELANRALGEAISLYASLADRGPNYRKWLRSVEGERDSLDEYVRITSVSRATTTEPTSDWTAPELLVDYIAQIDRGIALTQQGDLRAAQEVLMTAAAALDLLRQQEPAGRIAVETGRQLARARWRLALVQHALGNQSQARPTGLLAVQTGRGWLDALPPGSDRRPEAVAEVATMAIDTAEISFAADKYEEGLALLEEATSLCWNEDHENHPVVSRALATAFHNHANALLAPIGTEIVDAGRVREQVAEFRKKAFSAMGLRFTLRAADDPLTWFELANSMLLASIACAMQNEPDQAATLLAATVEQTISLNPGTAVDRLRARARQHAGQLERAVPEAAATYRARGHWPAP
jgi:tetratricopeptide (TPR) repeat protein